MVEKKISRPGIGLRTPWKFFYLRPCLQLINSPKSQCHRQSKQSEWALAKNGGALKLPKYLQIKTDILWPQIKRYLKNFVFMFEKKTY